MIKTWICFALKQKAKATAFQAENNLCCGGVSAALPCGALFFSPKMRGAQTRTHVNILKNRNFFKNNIKLILKIYPSLGGDTNFWIRENTIGVIPFHNEMGWKQASAKQTQEDAWIALNWTHLARTALAPKGIGWSSYRGGLHAQGACCIDIHFNNQNDLPKGTKSHKNEKLKTVSQPGEATEMIAVWDVGSAMPLLTPIGMESATTPTT